MAKDRAAPFSRKHRRYWLPVTGGMVLIGVINVALGLWMRPPPNDAPPELIIPVVPPSTYRLIDARPAATVVLPTLPTTTGG